MTASARLLFALCIFAAVLPAHIVKAAPPDSPVPDPKNPVIALDVDATDAPRNLLHAHLSFPVKPGPLTLYYPEWIPGDHRPSGPLVQLAGPTLTANGQPIPWRRDLEDMYTLHCTIPSGVTRLDTSLDFLLSTDTNDSTETGSLTPELTVLHWNDVLLYPAGRTADGWTYAATLHLPQGWKFGTPLPVASQTGDTITFQPAPLVTLVDSTLTTGEHYRVISLTAPGASPPAEIDLAVDDEKTLQVPEEFITSSRQMVAEADALFGARHYRDYHWLLTLSDRIASDGIEHHECSDDRDSGDSLDEESVRAGIGELLTHEYVHSWNGKYRRPAGLYTTDYQKPQHTDLLWVYEGLTQYYGYVLQARSGFAKPEFARDEVALTAASLDHRPGRQWRPLQDTADSASFLRVAPRAWGSLRRGQDYYSEGQLIWLEADTIIRKKTNGTRSLDDFCRDFFGGVDTSPLVKTYAFEDVIAALNAIAPYDWAAFFTTRLNATGPNAPLGGIVASGWKLTYGDQMSAAQKAFEGLSKSTDVRYSLGFSVARDGTIRDVTPGTPAYQVGMGPGEKLIGVNDLEFTGEILRAAIKEAKTDPQPIRLLVSFGGHLRTFSLDYHSGEQYPRLVRDETQPDLLSAIFAARTPSLAPPSPPAAKP